MNRVVVLIFGILVLWSCSSNKPLVKIENSDTVTDSIEYDLIVLEPGFHSWYVTKPKPIWFYEENYYKQFNQLYTNAWNNRVLSMRYDFPFQEIIDYNISINYGKELEYKLYCYFLFMMDKYDFSLLVTDNR